MGEHLTAALDLHLHPHYREQRPIDAVLRKTNAALDDFSSEKYHDQIAAILKSWSSELLKLAHGPVLGESVRSTAFRGCSLRPVQVTTRRDNGWLTVRQLSFAARAELGSDAFVREWTAYFKSFSQVLVADFQITRIDADTPGRVATEVRYELVGTGEGFYREQRVGVWNLTWQRDGDEKFRLESWMAAHETRSSSIAPVYEDQTRNAFGANRSYDAQLVHGVDYWRTVLDSACGIDVYGHNGVSVGDIDGDGFDDVYICQPAGLPNRLFRNRGDGTFEDITEGSGLGILENTACALFADFNNSGRQDVVVVRANGPLLFRNEGGGKFREIANAFRFATPPQGTFTGPAAADYDRDGWLDIYFCLYTYYQGTDQYKYPTPYFDANNGPPNFLMRNHHDGTFRDGTAHARLDQNNARYSFCCGWVDLNGDGWPDLYVANDFGRKNLYRNNGDGTFSDVAAEAGVDDVGAGMSVCCFDYDNDGALDLYVADMWTAAGERITNQSTFQQKSSAAVRALYQKHAMGNSLFHNANEKPGSLRFEDKTAQAGAGLGRWSWSSDAWDFDHDGFVDLYVTNGMISGPLHEDLNSFFWRQVVAKSPDTANPSPSYEQGWNAINELIRADYSWSGFERNVFFANNSDGTFSDISGTIGLDFLEDGRAFALADFDHDGRLEVVLKNRNGPQLRLLKNVIKDLPPSISFRLRGTKSNRDAIGAVIIITTEHGRQTRTLQAGSGFLSQHSKEIFFGLGGVNGTIDAMIRWPSGLEQSLCNLAANHRIIVEEGAVSYKSEAFEAVRRGAATEQPKDVLPEESEAWLLAPLTAPDFVLPGGSEKLSSLRGRDVLLRFSNKQTSDALSRSSGDIQFITIDTDEPSNQETGAVYNILYRSLFDRHCDMTLPTSLLINRAGEIVKVYQGSLDANKVVQDIAHMPDSTAERLSRALPFPESAASFSFGRNYLSLGSLYFQRGYFAQAEDVFRVALRENDRSAEAYYGLGSACLKQAKNDEAHRCFEQATDTDANYPDTKPNAWNNLGLIAAQQGQIEAAIGYFERALQQRPDYAIALENLGNAYRQAKRWEEARRTLERALEVAPEEADVNYSLGMVFAQTDEPGRALSLLHRAIELRPDYAEAMNNLGVLYLRTRRRDEAVTEFEECIRVAPDFDQSYLNVARVYAIEGEREKARATLLALLKVHPHHARAEAALAELK